MGNYQTTALLGDTNKFFIPWLIPRNDRNSIFRPNILGKLVGRTKRDYDDQGKFTLHLGYLGYMHTLLRGQQIKPIHAVSESEFHE